MDLWTNSPEFYLNKWDIGIDGPYLALQSGFDPPDDDSDPDSDDGPNNDDMSGKDVILFDPP